MLPVTVACYCLTDFLSLMRCKRPLSQLGFRDVECVRMRVRQERSEQREAGVTWVKPDAHGGVTKHTQ